ncbi:accessory factor UbiK family protein [Thioalkalivibrio sulfidiphilus]|uniref:Ubiquinone biosynthesis accessory factor UbiK n=1 Tax=Thioalkalivibrio sulfidiphilus (strain HL-EbGR7) TaxID=396588 RepID=B8GQ21_THISH|nr:accessory factor UbiK family protein [Thioalkalivibrio sulfidiphilus]ACL74168.1 conserved hypothetical protein [Thioalkalivibrio sulfidiphilus HL-EbGr7]
MRDTQGLDDLVRKLADLMPEPAKQFQQEMEKNLRAGLASALQRMDLVTREEYEVQTTLLARSRERLAELEARVAALEAALAPGHGSGQSWQKEAE